MSTQTERKTMRRTERRLLRRVDRPYPYCGAWVSAKRKPWDVRAARRLARRGEVFVAVSKIGLLSGAIKEIFVTRDDTEARRYKVRLPSRRKVK